MPNTENKLPINLRKKIAFYLICPIRVENQDKMLSFHKIALRTNKTFLSLI